MATGRTQLCLINQNKTVHLEGFDPKPCSQRLHKSRTGANDRSARVTPHIETQPLTNSGAKGAPASELAATTAATTITETVATGVSMAKNTERAELKLETRLRNLVRRPPSFIQQKKAEWGLVSTAVRKMPHPMRQGPRATSNASDARTQLDRSVRYSRVSPRLHSTATFTIIFATRRNSSSANYVHCHPDWLRAFGARDERRGEFRAG
jgi:hypothetical protein